KLFRKNFFHCFYACATSGAVSIICLLMKRPFESRRRGMGDFFVVILTSTVGFSAVTSGVESNIFWPSLDVKLRTRFSKLPALAIRFSRYAGSAPHQIIFPVTRH